MVFNYKVKDVEGKVVGAPSNGEVSLLAEPNLFIEGNQTIIQGHRLQRYQLIDFRDVQVIKTPPTITVAYANDTRDKLSANNLEIKYRLTRLEVTGYTYLNSDDGLFSYKLVKLLIPINPTLQRHMMVQI